MEQRGLCSQGRASHCMVDVGVEEGGPANALLSGLVQPGLPHSGKG
jgi:hypothetical protein